MDENEKKEEQKPKDQTAAGTSSPAPATTGDRHIVAADSAKSVESHKK